ncbi:MAG: calcium-binding protein [Nitrososphaeraceae archaeon]
MIISMGLGHETANGKKLIGTQTIIETPLGKKTRCAGNLLAPMIICNGTGGNDTIIAPPRDGTIFGLKGDDKIQGVLGTEVTFGNTGNDAIQAGNGSSILFGNTENDVLVGGGGPNILFGGGGSTIFGGKGDDQLIGGFDLNEDVKIAVWAYL